MDDWLFSVLIALLWNLRYNTADIAELLGLEEAEVWNYKCGADDGEGTDRRTGQRCISGIEKKARSGSGRYGIQPKGGPIRRGSLSLVPNAGSALGNGLHDGDSFGR